MTSSTPAAGQLQQCLIQLIAADSAASATAALDALLQVSWFADLAAVAACDVLVSSDGALALPCTPQQQDAAAETQAEQLSHLLAALLAKLSHQHEDVAANILQTLLPQLLACQHAASSTGSNSWVPAMCRTVAELYANGHAAAQQLAAACVQQLEQHMSALQSAAPTVGQLACMQLLAAILQPSSRKAPATAGSRQKAGSVTQPATTAAAAAGTGRSSTSTGLQPELLQRLLDCVVPNIASSGEAALGSVVSLSCLVKGLIAIQPAIAGVLTCKHIPALQLLKACKGH
jgi:hypothetical protein